MFELIIFNTKTAASIASQFCVATLPFTAIVSLISGPISGSFEGAHTSSGTSELTQRRTIMKKILLAIVTMASLTSVASADPGSNGESRFEPFTPQTTEPVIVEPANASPDTEILVLKKTDTAEDRRLDEKNGSSD
jgi:uncharacterized membrane protein